MANWRALKQVLNTAIHVASRGIKQRMTSPASWRYPLVAPVRSNSAGKSGHPEEQLDTALRNRVEGLRLGGQC